jgi:ferredoxin
VIEGDASIPPPKTDELAMLDRAVDRRPNSRLGCQAVPDGSLDVVVQIPADQ